MWFGEMSVGEISFRGIVRSVNCPSGNCPSEKSPSGKSLSGKCPSGNCPDTFQKVVFWKLAQNFTFYFSYCSRFFCACCGNVEVNPGPQNKYNECLSIFHCNLNSISTHDFSKLFLLKAYNSAHKFDISCLWEPYFDCPVPHEMIIW